MIEWLMEEVRLIGQYPDIAISIVVGVVVLLLLVSIGYSTINVRRF